VTYSDSPEQATVKSLVDALNAFLLENHSRGRNTLVIIEEAQNLSDEVLEQLRLLTNLETSEKKLLQIILLAQPEFLDTLKQDNMKQLAQRITARFHLTPLSAKECDQYIQHRLSVAGATSDPFPKAIKKAIYSHSGGVPRVINLIADRCLLGAYSRNQKTVSKDILKHAVKELKGEKPVSSRKFIRLFVVCLALLAISAIPAYFYVQAPATFSNVWLSSDNSGSKQSSVRQAPSYGTSIYTQNANEAYLDILYNPELHVALNSFSNAASQLNALWGLSYSANTVIDGPQSLCDFALQWTLSCYHEKANMGLLLKLGRPAILKLVSSEGESYYAVLLGLRENELLLQFAEGVKTIPFHEMEKHWLGEFYVLVKTPAGWKGQVLNLQESGLLFEWLRDALITLGYPLNKNSIVYNKEQQVLVKSLQAEAGIQADGKVGLKTVMYLNSMLDNGVPRLSGVFVPEE
jgi:general secretion pathway protein A